MVILSIDPGLEKTGYAIFDRNNNYSEHFKFIFSGIIKTDKTIPDQYRIQHIYNKFKKIIQKFRPKTIVIEKIFFFKNQKTIIKVAQSQGIILLIASQNNIAIEQFTPLQIKLAVTGYGLADKKAIKKMIDFTLKLKKQIEDDEYDAIACGLTYCLQNNKLLQ